MAIQKLGKGKLIVFNSRVGTWYEAHGVKLHSRVLYNVSDELYEFLKHIRGMVPITDVETELLDFPKKKKGKK